jgi:hypothetical protein
MTGEIMFRILWEIEGIAAKCGYVTDNGKEMRFQDAGDAEHVADKFRRFQASPDGNYPPIFIYTVVPIRT